MTRRLNQRLTIEDATDIKLRLWLCEPQHEVAAIHNVSQTTISRILHGRQWYEARWPSGEVGPMPNARIKQLKAIRPWERGLHHAEVDAKARDVQTTTNSDNVSDPDTIRESNSVADEDVSDDTIRSGQNLTASQSFEQDIERFRSDKEVRAEALQILGNRAEEEMQDELEAIVTASQPETSPSTPTQAQSSPTYELLPWDIILDKGKDIPLVILSEESEELKECVRAAFNMLPVSQWKSHKAISLVREVAKSLGYDLTKIVKE